jgi:hypothetical protein
MVQLAQPDVKCEVEIVKRFAFESRQEIGSNRKFR